MNDSKDQKAAAEPPLDCRVRLLPCPFCGTKPELEKWHTAFKIECKNYKCDVSTMVVGESKKEVALIWNKRVPNA